jgi:hypothetical protein
MKAAMAVWEQREKYKVSLQPHFVSFSDLVGVGLRRRGSMASSHQMIAGGSIR